MKIPTHRIPKNERELIIDLPLCQIFNKEFTLFSQLRCYLSL